jgi:hypothetical protein
MYTHQKVACLPIMALRTMHNIMHMCKVLLGRSKLHHVLFCYSSSVQVDTFILTTIYIIRVAFRTIHNVMRVKTKGKDISVIGYGGPAGLGNIEVPTFLRQVSSQMAVRLSSLCTGCPSPPGRFLVLISSFSCVCVPDQVKKEMLA